MKESNWFKIDVCIDCKKHLKENYVLYNSGICPYCGHDSKSNYCHTQTIIIKKIKLYEWWQFWKILKPKYYYKGRDMASRLWLLQNNFKLIID